MLAFASRPAPSNAYDQMMPTSPHSMVSTRDREVSIPSQADGQDHLPWLPKAESMEVTNDPRFMANSVIAKRLAAFQTVSVVAVLMVNLSVKQMFTLEKNIHLNTVRGCVQYLGYTIMSCVFLMNLFTVIVVVQQLFMTYRLLTAGPTGFEVAKSFYLESNIVSLRHSAVKAFLFSLPLFVASTCCMIFVAFDTAGTLMLAIPSFLLLGVGAAALMFVNMKHSNIFKERYALAKAHEQPLLSHVNAVTSRNAFQGLGLDV